jgi:O-methyltransferase involved in polyketide biosynthesis
MTDEETRTNDDMRLVVSGAGQTLMIYAASDAFDWEKHAHLLRPIIANAEELMGIIDAYNEEHKDDLKNMFDYT